MRTNTWFTSDWHLCHAAVIQYSNRPFASVAEMNRALITRYNRVVADTDFVYFLGDLTLAPYKEAAPLLQELKGNKILVQGNHDHFSMSQYRDLRFLVHEEILIRLFGRRVRLSHYPRRPSWISRLLKPAHHFRYLDRRPAKDGRWLLHGHTHSMERLNLKRKTIHVGVDAWNFEPVPLRAIEQLIARAEC